MIINKHIKKHPLHTHTFQISFILVLSWSLSPFSRILSLSPMCCLRSTGTQHPPLNLRKLSPQIWSLGRHNFSESRVYVVSLRSIRLSLSLSLSLSSSMPLSLFISPYLSLHLRSSCLPLSFSLSVFLSIYLLHLTLSLLLCI